MNEEITSIANKNLVVLVVIAQLTHATNFHLTWARMDVFEIEAAVKALFCDSTSPQIRSQADSFLKGFRDHPDPYEICRDLVLSPTSSHQVQWIDTPSFLELFIWDDSPESIHRIFHLAPLNYPWLELSPEPENSGNQYLAVFLCHRPIYVSGTGKHIKLQNV